MEPFRLIPSIYLASIPIIIYLITKKYISKKYLKWSNYYFVWKKINSKNRKNQKLVFRIIALVILIFFLGFIFIFLSNYNVPIYINLIIILFLFLAFGGVMFRDKNKSKLSVFSRYKDPARPAEKDREYKPNKVRSDILNFRLSCM